MENFSRKKIVTSIVIFLTGAVFTIIAWQIDGVKDFFKDIELSGYPAAFFCGSFVCLSFYFHFCYGNLFQNTGPF